MSAPEHDEALGDAARGRTILVIDDQQLVASMLAYSLRDHGLDAHYLLFTDLEAVETAALAYLPGLVLLDLDLGDGPDGEPMNGVDLIVPLAGAGVDGAGDHAARPTWTGSPRRSRTGPRTGWSRERTSPSC